MEPRATREERILVVGRPSPLLEGVADLLQIAGFRVDLLATWVEAEQALNGRPPNLTIVDPSALAGDPLGLSFSIANASDGTGVPILCVGFPDDASIRELRRHSQRGNGRRLRFFSHSVLGMNGLLDAVEACLV